MANNRAALKNVASFALKDMLKRMIVTIIKCQIFFTNSQKNMQHELQNN